MIRPLTCVCFLLACGSGLYLYQAKHRAQLLDREIEKSVRDTDALREQTRVLHAEWTLLNDPQRLQSLADQFLPLKTVTPGQFTSFAELDNHLPAVRAPSPPPEERPPETPIAQAPVVMQPEAGPPATAPAAKPVAVAAAAPPTRPAEHKPVPPRPAIAQANLARPEPRPASESRSASEPRAVAEYRPVAEVPIAAQQRIVPAAAPMPQPAAPFIGSALGMAHSTAAPPPRPMPVSASQWVTNGGGG